MTQSHNDAVLAGPPHQFVHPDPRKIIVPRKHGQVLIEPPLATLEKTLGETDDGRFRDISFAGQPLGKLRTEARAHMVRAATLWATKTESPPPPANALDHRWVLTGHQVEFYHAGVWAKVITADELAKRTSGVAFDILVDHDVVDHSGFDVPVQSGSEWSRKLVEWTEPSAVPADGLHAPDADSFEQWDADLAALPQSHTDSLAFFLAALKPSPEGGPRAYTEWLSSGRSRFEQSLNIQVHHVTTSELCTGPVWEGFVRAWMTHAEEWIATYNQHLAAYRAREQIKNPQHPMPDLSANGETLELPFWIYKVGEPRQRLLIRSTSEGQKILQGETEIDPARLFESATPVVIRPRALALTMFLRLFFADIFIHGIGGALYDQITDGILHDLFGIVPSYACVSAAWLLPLGQPLEGSDNLSILKSQRHHAAHNPQLFLDPFTARKPEVAEALQHRRALIDQMGESVGIRRHDRDARIQRAQWFRELHAQNDALHEKFPRILDALDRQLKDALESHRQNKVLLWREYFFALHTTESLQKLIKAIHRMGKPVS